MAAMVLKNSIQKNLNQGRRVPFTGIGPNSRTGAVAQCVTPFVF